MKKSELRQIIREEIQKLDEKAFDKPKYIRHINVPPNNINVILYNDRIQIVGGHTGYEEYIMIDELPDLIKALKKIK